MAVSILHRITGAGLATLGAAVFVWWLYAAARGAEAYAVFVGWAMWKWSLIIWIGLTWAFFQHLLSGIRHLVMDTGAAFELGINKTFAILTILGSIALTAAVWVYVLEFRP